MPVMTDMEVRQKAISAREEKPEVSSETIPGFFARGINFYKLFWLFLITAFLGCVIETVFMLVTRGQIQNRSGVIYGSFSLVWGLGAVFFTLLFQRFERVRGVWIFLGGTVMGAVYEYACSWLQEVLFGACFWDYSHLPFNINGRVNLIFSLFWGVAAVVWVKDVYPLMCRWIGKIPNRFGKPITVVLTVMMIVNVALSAAALGRMNERQLGQPPQGPVELFLDRRYPDEALQRIFTNLTYIGTDEARAAAGVPKTNDIPGK